MKQILPILATLFAVCVLGLAASAQTEERVTLQLRDTRLSSVLSLISSQTGKSVLAAVGVSGQIDVSVTNVSLPEALDTVARATGLTWRRLLAPAGSSSTDIARALTDAQAAPMSTIVIEQKGSSPAKAILSGSAADRIWDFADDLNMREIYWVYDPSSVVVRSRPSAATADTGPATEEPANEESVDEEGVAEAPANVYGSVTKSLSSLDAVEALNIVEQIRQEVMASMSPLELDSYFGVPYAPQPQAPVAWGPPRVRVGPPAPINVITQQPSPPWWW